MRSRAFVDINAVRSFIVSLEASLTNAEKAALCVFTVSMGAEVAHFDAFIFIDASGFLIIQLEAAVTDAGVATGQIIAVP